MKKLLFCLIALLFLAACDAPRAIRSKSLLSGSSSAASTAEDAASDDEESEYTSNINIGDISGYESCNLAYYSSSSTKSDVLRVGACRSTLSLNKFAFKFGYEATSDTATCFYPTYRNSSGVVQKIGDRTCLTHSKGEIKYDITVSTYSNLSSTQSFNGLMVVRKTHRDYFENCMTYSKSYSQMDYFVYGTQMVSCSELGTSLSASQLQYYPTCACWYFDQVIPYLNVEIYDYN